jgi:hypothetical protein
LGWWGFTSIVTTLFCSNPSIVNIFPENSALATSHSEADAAAAMLVTIPHALKAAFSLNAGSLHLGSCLVKSNEPTSNMQLVLSNNNIMQVYIG